MKLSKAVREATGLRNGSIDVSKAGVSRGEKANEARAKTYLGPFLAKIVSNLPSSKVLGKKSGKVCTKPMKPEKRQRIKEKLGVK
jgi:hypothetical protein